jgi:hypothetical protein
MRQGRISTYVVAVVRATNNEATSTGTFVMNVGQPRNSKSVHCVGRSTLALSM